MVSPDLKQAEKATINSSIVIVLLTILKGVAGFFSGSLVLVTDTLHSVTDLVANFASFFGIRIAQKKPSEKFPYGYFKAESLSALFISLFIIYLAFDFFIEGWNVLFQTSQIGNILLSTSAASLSVIVSFLLSRYLIKKGRQNNSQSLIANGREKRTDVITSSVVFLAIILSYFQIPYVEGIVTMAISGIVFIEGISSAKDSIFSLMDVSPSKEMEKQVVKAISEIKGVEGYGDLRLRKAGPFVFGEVNVMVRKQVNVKTAKRICDKIEEKTRKKAPELENLKISIVPYIPEQRTIAVPVTSKKENPRISKHFGRTKYFVFVRVKNKEIQKKWFVKNEFRKKDVRAGLSASHFLVEKNADVVIAKEMGEISFHVLRDHLVDVYKAGRGYFEKNIEKFVKNELKPLEKPTKQGFEKGKT